MSSFWSSFRHGRKSNSGGDSEESKPPSGRSSIRHRQNDSISGGDPEVDLPPSSSLNSKGSCSSKTADAEFQRQDSDEKNKKGCLKMSCLSGQGFPCKSLSSKLMKVQKSGSSSRKLSKTSDLPPTPLPTPEPGSMEFPDLSVKAPMQEVDKSVLKGNRKRAASASPSRLQGEKHKMFRGISRERLIAPLPASLRKLLQPRQSQSKPDISSTGKYPIKPLRKPGPLGKSWVKVYNDITYVDDTNEDNYPILGHSGYPVTIPEAVPLPKPPTPPPQKVKIYDITLQDIKPQKQSLTKEQVLNDIKTAEEPSLEEREAVRDEVVVSNKSDSINSGIIMDHKLIASNVECEYDLQKEYGERTKMASFKIERPSRNNDVVRHKAKRAKRSGTPIGADIVLRSPEEVAAAQVEYNRIGLSEGVMDDGYIIPGPPKPPRDNKVCEKVDDIIENRDVISDGTVVEPSIDVNEISKFNNKNFDNEIMIPERPKRGNKVYEGINGKTDKEHKPNEQPYENISEKHIAIEDREMNNKEISLSNESNEVITEPPTKPKRKPKMYVNVDNFLNSDEHSNVLRENVNTNNKDILPENPRKPTRGHKIYNKIGIEKETTLEDEICTQNSADLLEMNVLNKKSNDSCNKENIESKTNEIICDPYATVCKDRLSKELKEITPCKDTNESPPPIPPKKKDTILIETTKQQVLIQPQYSRSLILKSRSAESSPSRPRRKRIIAQINIESTPSRPDRSTKIYTELQLVQKTKIHRNTANKPGYNTNTNTIFKTKIPSKEFCQSCPLPPPPRPKKSPVVKRSKEVQPPKYDKENTPDNTSPQRHEAVQGKVYNSLIKSSSTRRNRPPPPPPPNLKGKMHDVQSQEYSRNDTTECQESDFANISVQTLPLNISKLNDEIDVNLRNIEHSFKTLDSVLHSLKSYVNLPPAWSHDPPAWPQDRSKRRLSCEVVCDQLTEFDHSNNQENIIKGEASHNRSGWDSPNQFIGVNARENSDHQTSDIVEMKNETSLSQDGDTDRTSCSKNETDLELSQKIEYQVSVPSIIPVLDKTIPISDTTNKLSCLLNIEPKTSTSEDVQNLESEIFITTMSPISSEPDISDRNEETINTQVIDVDSEILDHYEGEIKEITKGLSSLRTTLERCESDYSEDPHNPTEKVVVGTLSLGEQNIDKDSVESHVITGDIINIGLENQIVRSDNSLNQCETKPCSSLDHRENRVTLEEEFEGQHDKTSLLEGSQVTCSFQENIGDRPSKPEKTDDKNFSESVLSIDEMLQISSTKDTNLDQHNLPCGEIQAETSRQTMLAGSEICDSTTTGTTSSMLPSLQNSPTSESSTSELKGNKAIDKEHRNVDCHIPNKDSTHDSEINEDDSSEEMSEKSSCTVEEVKVRSGTVQHPDESDKYEVTTQESNPSDAKDVNISWIVMAATGNTKEVANAQAKSDDTQMQQLPHESTEAINPPEEQTSTSDLLHGVADMTGKLEGIRSQLETVVANCFPPSGLVDSSFDYTSSESPASSISNRSSLTFDQAESNRSSLNFDQVESNRSSLTFDRTESNRSSFNFDQTESSSNASYYSLSQPSLSNYSLLSYYTARSTASPALSESPTNTPSVGSFKDEHDDLTEPDSDDQC